MTSHCPIRGQRGQAGRSILTVEEGVNVFPQIEANDDDDDEDEGRHRPCRPCTVLTVPPDLLFLPKPNPV